MWRQPQAGSKIYQNNRTVADERSGYLAGVGILVDGGCTTLKKF